VKKKAFAILFMIVFVFVFALPTYSQDVDWLEWKEAPPLPSWTIVFSFHSQKQYIFTEIIVGTNKDNSPLIKSSRSYSEPGTQGERKTFFEAVYLGENAPYAFIEMISRGEEECLSAITEDKLDQLIDLIRENQNWIILKDN